MVSHGEGEPFRNGKALMSTTPGSDSRTAGDSAGKGHRHLLLIENHPAQPDQEWFVTPDCIDIHEAKYFV